MKLVVGLGNPDPKYLKTRHNVGFMVVDSFAKKTGLTFKTVKSFVGETAMGKDYILLKPLTYMNLSGNAVSLVSHYYHVNPQDILVVSDDFNLPFAKIRLRDKGAAGGHNGLKSIISCLNTDEFKRLRIGLGDPGDDSIDFVLGRFSKTDKQTF